MSGIVCVFQRDGAPVDRQVVQRMTDFQAFRGPDAQRVWVASPIGLGHTMLRTTAEAEREEQPFSLDGKVWIVADARVDGRPDLAARLRGRGQTVAPGAPDAEFILRAYHAWGQDCTEHLIGDFAFVIWDQRENYVFAVRDQMGVRQLFYAETAAFVILSNSLDCIRRHPAVSTRLDDQTIAQFLVFEAIQDRERTAFADIRRLPPGCCATWTPDGHQWRRYWTLPFDEPVFYKRAGDYLERYHELLGQAVGDRLRTPRAGIMMSGGLDSTAVTATARRIHPAASGRLDLGAFTMVDEFLPEERSYAGMAAERIGIPIQYFEWQGKLLNPLWEQTPLRTPEPDGSLISFPVYQNFWRRLASFSPVALQGEGGDNPLEHEWRPYLAYLYRQGHYLRLIGAVCSDFVAAPHVPFAGRIRRAVENRLAAGEEQPYIPWLNPDLEAKFEMRERWEKFEAHHCDHPTHPSASRIITGPHYEFVFQVYDAARTGLPLEVRHPYLDLRLMQYMLSVPAMPWCRSKRLVRRALRGTLPEPVLRRKKAGIPAAMVVDRLLGMGVGPLEPAPEFSAYVNLKRLPEPPPDNAQIAHNVLRARILNHWLRYSLKPA